MHVDSGKAATPATAGTSRQDFAVSQSRWRVKATRLGFLVGALALAAWGLWHNPALRDRRLAGMSLTALQREARAHPDDPDALYYMGLRLNEQGRFAEAVPLLKSAAIAAPDQARIREAWMRALLGTGRMADAYQELKQFADAFPNLAASHRLLGQFYVLQHSMVKASAELNRAVQIDPNDRAAWVFLATARDDIADPQGAIAAEERAIALRSDYAGDHLYLGSLYARSSRAQDALREYQQAVRLDPRLAAEHREVARWLLANGAQPSDPQRAEAEAREAVRLDGQDGLAQQTLGEALARQGKAPEALAPLEAAARLASDDPAPARRLADLERALGHTEAAGRWQREYLARQSYTNRVRSLVEAIEMHPDQAPPHAQLADLLARHGDAEGSLRQYAAAMRLSPEAPQVVTSAVRGLLAGGHGAEAAALARRLPQPALSPAEKAYQEARRLETTSVGPKPITTQVEQLAQQAVALAPANTTYLSYLLHLQVALRHNDAAIETARRLIARAPSDASAHALLGILLLDRAASKEALEAAEAQLRAVPPPNPAVAAEQRFGLGLLALQRHQARTAVAELKAALQLDPEADATYYKLALAENELGDTRAGAAYMAQYQDRQAFEKQEADLLGDIAQHPDQAGAYERAIAFLKQHGLSPQAEAVRAAERRRHLKSL